MKSNKVRKVKAWALKSYLRGIEVQNIYRTKRQATNDGWMEKSLVRITITYIIPPKSK